jgi:hypothetical protein
MDSIPAPSWRRSLAFVGANPGLALHPVDARGVQIPGEAASCFASFWMAEWSRWGTGDALLVATQQGWRSYGTNEYFASTLAAELARYFPEAARFPLNGITHTQDEFDVALDLERGFRAVGRKAELELWASWTAAHFPHPTSSWGQTPPPSTTCTCRAAAAGSPNSVWSGPAPQVSIRDRGARRRRAILPWPNPG